MVSLTLLKSAKSFLCWDALKDLSIQLVPVQKKTAYYFPPNNPLHSIVVFYNPDDLDNRLALFYLFHEAGHVKQQQEYHENNIGNTFWEMINLDKGQQKQEFEKMAWQFGKNFLERFLLIEKLDSKLLYEYEKFSETCVQSYSSQE